MAESNHMATTWTVWQRASIHTSQVIGSQTQGVRTRVMGVANRVKATCTEGKESSGACRGAPRSDAPLFEVLQAVPGGEGWQKPGAIRVAYLPMSGNRPTLMAELGPRGPLIPRESLAPLAAPFPIENIHLTASGIKAGPLVKG